MVTITPTAVNAVAEYLITPAGKSLFRASREDSIRSGLPTDTANAFALQDVFHRLFSSTVLPQDGWSELVDFFEWNKIARVTNVEKMKDYLMTCLSYVGFISDEIAVEETELDSVEDMNISPVELFDTVITHGDLYIAENSPYSVLNDNAKELLRYATLRAMGIDSINEFDGWDSYPYNNGDDTLEDILQGIADYVGEPDDYPELVYTKDIWEFFDAHVWDCEQHLDSDVKDCNDTITGMVSDLVHRELAEKYGSLMYGLGEFITEEIEEKFHDA